MPREAPLPACIVAPTGFPVAPVLPNSPPILLLSSPIFLLPSSHPPPTPLHLGCVALPPPRVCGVTRATPEGPHA